MTLTLPKALGKITFLFIFFISVLSASAQVTLPHYDGMNYTEGTSLQTQTGWTSMNSGDNLAITSGSLSYTGLPAFVGNKVSFDANGIDAAKSFTQQTSGTVYYSFLMNVTALGSLGSGGGYFAGFTEGAGTTFGATVWTRQDGAGYDIGISPRTTAASTVWSSGTTAINTTVLVVISYQMISGTQNDQVRLWINPTLGQTTEPTATLSAINTGTNADLLNVNRIFLRQDSASATPFITMDEFRIGTTWESVTPGGGIGLSVSGTLGSLTTIYGTPSTTAQFTTSGSMLNEGITITPPVGFEIATTSDFSTTIGTNTTPLVIGAAGNVANTTIYVRLSAHATAGNHTGDIVLTSSGATAVSMPTNATNTVNPKALTITGITANNKPFDNTTTATLSGTPVLQGIVTGDEANVVLGGTPMANFNDVAVGNNKPVTVTGYTISGPAAANYTLTQPTGLLASIEPSGLQDQTITFGALAPVTYGVAPFNLTATATSGLTVTYISSDTNIATISGSLITVVGVGTVTITAEQAGNGSYNAATDVTQQLLVNPKGVTIANAQAQNKPYDGNTTAVITGTLSGVINNDAVTLNLSGNFDDANIGNNKPVTSTSTLSGTHAARYVLQQPSGLMANITLGACGVSSAGTINWNFTPGATATSDNSEAATSSAIAFGNNNGTTTTLISGTSVSSGYAGASGGQNAGVAVFNGALNPATSTYFEFTLTPESGFNFTLTGISFGSRSTNTGPLAYALRSSLDNFGSNIATGTINNNSTWVLQTPATTPTTSSNAAVTYRIYGYNGVNPPGQNTANWRIDDLNLQLSATPTTALSSAATASVCSGEVFPYTPTTHYSGATITWTRAAVAGISNPAVTTPQTSNPSETLINTTSSPVDVIYHFTVTTATCTISQDVIVSIDNCNTASEVNLKLFVEAYYEGGAMRPVKNNQDLTSPMTDVEDITIELRDAQAPYAVLHTATALLKTDGTAQAAFEASPNGAFYIAVKGKNFLQTWSAAPQTIGPAPLNYDFTTAANKAYGDNMIVVSPGVFAFYSGDINQDETIDNTDGVDLTNDIDNSEYGIRITDLNGDGAVDNSDTPFFENNTTNSIYSIHP